MEKKEAEIKVKRDLLWNRVKESIFKKELYNQKSLVFKITLAGVFLAIAVGLSLLEIFDIPMPWGATFGIRFFDTLVLIYSVAIIGLWFALLDGIALPWLHNLVDGHHSWLEMAFFMLSNILVIFITWFIYYILFSAYRKEFVEENVDDHNIHNPHLTKSSHDHHHRIVKVKFWKKILAFSLIVPLCAIVEALAVLFVAKILLSTGAAGFEVHSETVEHISGGLPFDSGLYHNHGGSNDLSPIFASWKNTLIFIGIFFGIFVGKYTISAILFIVLEQRSRQLIDRYGIYV
ncbi:ECF transporter S component [Spiroplasma chrysopicola]|uniref:Transmembrane protein n=1 Tax=Spiroplasma chrysopicola DF-1 TaxID=1276227 RepID=R4UJ11_9MOLU|nr:ECF transporter S component [Spiroplasma chrysopicola]AGM25301.1 hypothetical protein SCHRY_v1c07250 [Spiroplasma chrysopicola DF-1]